MTAAATVTASTATDDQDLHENYYNDQHHICAASVAHRLGLREWARQHLSGCEYYIGDGVTIILGDRMMTMGGHHAHVHAVIWENGEVISYWNDRDAETKTIFSWLKDNMKKKRSRKRR